MKLYVDLETLQLIEGPGFRSPVTAIRFKRGDAALLEVTFLSGGSTPATLGDPDTLELRFGIKPRNRYDTGYLVHSSVWTMPGEEAESPTYLCSPSFNTTELDSALGVGSSTGSELSEITLMGEITWREGAGLPTSTRTFLVVVENDVNRGTEGVPTSAVPPYPAPANIVTLSTLGNHAVRFDLAQSLTTEQKAQARGNIGAGTAEDGVALGDNNNWTGENTFSNAVQMTSSLVLNYGSTAGYEIYYRDPVSGALTALPIGTDGQVLTVSASVPTWVTPITTSEWIQLGEMSSDGMSNTFYPLPWVPPTFNGDTEEVLFRVTANANSEQTYYLDFGLSVGTLEMSVVSQTFMDGPTVYLDNYGSVYGIMPPTTMIRTNDTFQFILRVPAVMLPYGVFDYLDPFSGPMGTFSNGSHFTVEYKIQPRSI